MSFGIPLGKLGGFSLESRVGDITPILSGERESWKTGEILWSTDDLPDSLLKYQISDLVYLDSPIDAIVSISYLKSLDPMEKISLLFIDDDPRFFPVQPDGLK
ncbi:hypothetical protein COU60_05010 [Candidatus Pacearchaeota archaeon CG10_big_fil_rev_8_21_14_0_10_34_76]|nr:MAG: hypothetical protein COU60_05010 [Candidatus Pacearchaeota archaeon CG10_big_fil_rev_8_21_14_0_10_34_76]